MASSVWNGFDSIDEIRGMAGRKNRDNWSVVVKPDFAYSEDSPSLVIHEDEACVVMLIDQRDRLHIDSVEFVMENYQESATNINGIAGAFFTPTGLASDFAMAAQGHKTYIDLCAGIGKLAWAVLGHEPNAKVVCVEMNPEYAAIGKRLLPQAEWIISDVFNLPGSILTRHFDAAISNPPFGNVGTVDGALAHYKVVELASKLADWGFFILPQMACPFKYSGVQNYEDTKNEAYQKFNQKTGIELTLAISVDTSQYIKDWHAVSPMVEICEADFEEIQQAARQLRLERVLSYGE